MAIKDMIANMKSFDLQMNSSCQYQKKHMRRVWRKWILMSGCKGLISTNSGCSFCHDHVDHITMHSTALTTRPPPPFPDFNKATTPSLGIFASFTLDDIFRASKKKELCFQFMENVLFPVDICPQSAFSSVNTHRPHAFVPSHEYLNIDEERSQYFYFCIKKNPC